MYSRSYGSIESERKNDVISIPPDYNGSLYAKKNDRPSEQEKETALPKKEEAPKNLKQEPEPIKQTSGFFGNLLEKFTAEDIILFVLVFSLLKEDGENQDTILAVILALLLL